MKHRESVNLSIFHRLLWALILLGFPYNSVGETLKVDLFSLPKLLTARILGSASEYIVVSQCLRNLIKIDENGQISGDLASSWQVSPDFKEFTFKLKSDQKFSNGEVILPKDVIESWEHPDLKKISIHFDFHSIKTLAVEGQKLRVLLKESNPFFLYNLRNPEFGVFHKTDRVNTPKLKVTSGPYFISQFGADLIELKKNPHFDHDGPNQIDFVALGAEKYDALTNGNLDLALLWDEPTAKQESQIRNAKDVKISIPHVGFTFWVTLNPKSTNFSSVSNRQIFQSTLKKKFDALARDSATWQRAKQLFLPEGPGRITKSDEASFWSQRLSVAGKLKNVKKLEGLITKRFQFTKDFETALAETKKALGIEISLTEYSTQEEFTQLLQKKNWDFYLINNDFSSYELVQNLIVTFNSTKALIVLPEQPPALNKLWTSIRQAPEAEVRHKEIEKLAMMILEEALIVPLLYKQVPIFSRANVDLSSWSNLFPEFSFWKVKLKKHGDANN